MSNMARAALTLSILTVSFPCSSSRIKRSPSPLRAANSSCVSPAAFRFFLINSAILFTIRPPPLNRFMYILYPNRYKIKLISIILYPMRCKCTNEHHRYTLSGIIYSSNRTLCRKEAHFRSIFQTASNGASSLQTEIRKQHLVLTAETLGPLFFQLIYIPLKNEPPFFRYPNKEVHFSFLIPVGSSSLRSLQTSAPHRS